MSCCKFKWWWYNSTFYTHTPSCVLVEFRYEHSSFCYRELWQKIGQEEEEVEDGVGAVVEVSSMVVVVGGEVGLLV